MSQYLDDELMKYSRSDYYPFHMPGHKRQKLGDFLPEEIDITEIDGFDNLHHAEGILREGQERLARVFGADESFYLVNGSTGGLLSAICGCIRKGDRILIGRNCHKAVYHAAYLTEAKVEYLYPEPTEFEIQGSIAPEQVEEKLKEYPDVRAVVITSPTYDGIVSDISSIAEVVHRHGILLIVDEAHGAHFGFSEGFPKKAIALGADLCIESLHKTLPAYTQTAVLHMVKQSNRSRFEENVVSVNNGRMSPSDDSREYWLDSVRVRRYLGIFQSSSPSYVLMAGIDRCVRMVEEDVKRYAQAKTRQESLFWKYEERLRRFYERCEGFRFVEVFPYMNSGEGAEGVFEKDNSKILISAEAAGLHGQQLYDLLLERYHLQMEMASGHYVTALTSIMDTEEGFQRLYDALHEIDESAAEPGGGVTYGENQQVKEEWNGSIIGKTVNHCHSADWLTPVRLYSYRKKAMELVDAIDADHMSLALSESEGRISGDFVWLYPPGVPILMPGELITGDVLELLAICRARHMQVQGMQDKSGEKIQIVTGV
ncbi:MAG: aminotransferase class V-fold PLP-dependent enzyme [Clostridiales bacterium]|nr:aminotransferase class V-fold PLP-dependent enzyme [Clostridiales bacterium]